MDIHELLYHLLLILNNKTLYNVRRLNRKMDRGSSKYC